MIYVERLRDLAATIEARDTPLGHDFSTGCWGAEAARIAGLSGASPCDFYGLSEETYEAKIKHNAAVPAEVRNKEMAAVTRALAAQMDS